jgi:hypothetical protein
MRRKGGILIKKRYGILKEAFEQWQLKGYRSKMANFCTHQGEMYEHLMTKG